MSASTTVEQTRSPRRPLTPWELPQLLTPMHRYKRSNGKQGRERPHYPAILGFVYRNRFAVASQIQRRFSTVLRSDRTARRHLEELEALGYLATAPMRGVSPLFPKVYFITGRGVRKLRESLAAQGKPWKAVRVDRRGRNTEEGYSADRVIHEILTTEFLLAVWQTVRRRGPAHRGVVGVEDVGSQHHADRRGVQRLEELGRLKPPAVHRLPRDADALPLEDAFQSVQGEMVGPLAHDHLRHQPRPRQSARDRLGRLGGHRHVLLGERQAALGKLLAAGVFLADVHRDEQRRGPPVELLAGLRRQLDQVLRAAQRRLLGVRKVVGLFLSFDLVGNSPATVFVAIFRNRRLRGRNIARGRRRGALTAVSSAPGCAANNTPCRGSSFSLVLP